MHCIVLVSWSLVMEKYIKDVQGIVCGPHFSNLLRRMGYGYLGMLLQVKCFSISEGGERGKFSPCEGEQSAYPSALIVNVSLLKSVIFTLYRQYLMNMNVEENNMCCVIGRVVKEGSP